MVRRELKREKIQKRRNITRPQADEYPGPPRAIEAPTVLSSLIRMHAHTNQNIHAEINSSCPGTRRCNRSI